ncbi:hypothetical protein AD936_15710, partial [Gluconobacter japonicus]
MAGHSNGLSFPLSPVVKTRITLKMTLACLTGFGSSAFSAPLDVSASKEEQIKVHHAERPEIQNFPHAGFLEQPRRLTTRQNLAPIGRQLCTDGLGAHIRLQFERVREDFFIH